MMLRHGNIRILAAVFIFGLLTLYRWARPVPWYDVDPLPVDQDSAPLRLGDDDVEVVIASRKKENTAWWGRNLRRWRKNIYVVDDPTARLNIPANKGREAMVYLT